MCTLSNLQNVMQLVIQRAKIWTWVEGSESEFLTSILQLQNITGAME